MQGKYYLKILEIIIFVNFKFREYMVLNNQIKINTIIQN